MIGRGKYEHRHEPESSDGLDDFLDWVFLGNWSSAQSSLQERRISLHKVESDRQRTHAVHREEAPRLPIVDRPCRKEQQNSHCDQYTQHAGKCLPVYLCHVALWGCRSCRWSAQSKNCRNAAPRWLYLAFSSAVSSAKVFST